MYCGAPGLVTPQNASYSSLDRVGRKPFPDGPSPSSEKRTFHDYANNLRYIRLQKVVGVANFYALSSRAIFITVRLFPVKWMWLTSIFPDGSGSPSKTTPTHFEQLSSRWPKTLRRA